MSDKAVEWLREQVQARLKNAQTATAGPWHWVDPGGRYKSALVSGGWRGAHGQWLRVLSVPGDGPLNADAEHIAANDPQDVIARCEAELAILGEHAGQKSDYGGHGFQHGEPACQMCGVDDGWGGHAWPCSTVRLLASGYRHRPGYAEHWGDLTRR